MGWGHLGTPGRVSPSRSQALKASGPVLTEGFSLKFKQRLFTLHFPPENESQWTKWYLLLSAADFFLVFFNKYLFKDKRYAHERAGCGKG